MASQDSQAPQSPLCQPPQLFLSTQLLPPTSPDLTLPVTRGQSSRDTELASRSTFPVSTDSDLEAAFQPPLWPQPPQLQPLLTEPLLLPPTEHPLTAMVSPQPLPTLHPTVMLDTATLFLPTHLSTRSSRPPHPMVHQPAPHHRPHPITHPALPPMPIPPPTPHPLPQRTRPRPELLLPTPRPPTPPPQLLPLPMLPRPTPLPQQLLHPTPHLPTAPPHLPHPHPTPHPLTSPCPSPRPLQQDRRPMCLQLMPLLRITTMNLRLTTRTEITTTATAVTKMRLRSQAMGTLRPPQPLHHPTPHPPLLPLTQSHPSPHTSPHLRQVTERPLHRLMQLQRTPSAVGTATQCPLTHWNIQLSQPKLPCQVTLQHRPLPQGRLTSNLQPSKHPHSPTASSHTSHMTGPRNQRSLNMTGTPDSRHQRSTTAVSGPLSIRNRNPSKPTNSPVTDRDSPDLARSTSDLSLPAHPHSPKGNPSSTTPRLLSPVLLLGLKFLKGRGSLLHCLAMVQEPGPITFLQRHLVLPLHQDPLDLSLPGQPTPFSILSAMLLAPLLTLSPLP